MARLDNAFGVCRWDLAAKSSILLRTFRLESTRRAEQVDLVRVSSSGVQVCEQSLIVEFRMN